MSAPHASWHEADILTQNTIGTMRRYTFLLSALLIGVMIAIGATTSHVTMTLTVDGSKFYPGTTRNVEVMVPDLYDGQEPACLYVGLDGNLCNAMAVMDSLMDAGVMPVTIGVMVQPGVITDSRGNVLRYNRSNEFDMPDGRFATFLEQQLLPQVERLTLPDGRAIKLSAAAGDRMIAGLSSGGIAAFNAAWHRPDLFARVYSGVGTFVAMRGGNDLQAVVRKHEPLPLRVFLQDGSKDAWNELFGHWYEGNRMLASALDFAGYELKCDWSDGGHNVVRSTQIYPEALTWLWHDHPTPPTRGTTRNNLLQSLLDTTDVEWHVMTLRADAPTVAARTAVYPDGHLVVTVQDGDNCLWQSIVDAMGDLTHSQRFYWLHSYDNAELGVGPMTFDGTGNLWVVTDAGIQVCDQNGRVRGIIGLPQGSAAAQFTAITVGNGMIILDGHDCSWQRAFHVTAPIPGETPTSQGQG